MELYRIIEKLPTDACQSVLRTSDMAGIPCVAENTDYQTFKAQINADEAQLEDVDGNLMTAEEAKAFVATLP